MISWERFWILCKHLFQTSSNLTAKACRQLIQYKEITDGLSWGTHCSQLLGLLRESVKFIETSVFYVAPFACNSDIVVVVV